MTMTTPRWLIVLAAALSLLAAVIHVWVMPEHFEEWWGYGTFFLVVAVAQALYAVLLLRGASSGLIWAGVLGNLAIIVLWAWTRTVGIPIFGPHAGEVEDIGALDVVSKIVEALLIACLIVLARGEFRLPDASDPTRGPRSPHPTRR
jgi:hypothetical protein